MFKIDIPSTPVHFADVTAGLRPNIWLFDKGYSTPHPDPTPSPL